MKMMNLWVPSSIAPAIGIFIQFYNDDDSEADISIPLDTSMNWRETMKLKEYELSSIFLEIWFRNTVYSHTLFTEEHDHRL